MGRIFSIDEFSVFDGEGIRVSVFLKGCPLRCVWCHSPEGQSSKPQYLRAPAGCIGCGKCLVEGQLRQESVERCPKGLIRLCGEDISAEALCKRLLSLQGLADGVTFSGGEPLLQGEFLLESLKLLAGKMHRAVQTCGYAPEETFAEVLQNCELVLMDLKLMDPAAHRKYTGADNTLILNNYRRLAKSGVELITRVPLIQGITDTEENLSSIAAFMAENGVNRVELLPSNPFVGAKYRAAGKTWDPPYDEKGVVQTRPEIWQKYGIEVKVL